MLQLLKNLSGESAHPGCAKNRTKPSDKSTAGLKSPVATATRYLMHDMTGSFRSALKVPHRFNAKNCRVEYNAEARAS